MIYPITDRLLPTINNAEFKRYAMRYLDIERQTQQAITQYGLSFEPAFSQQSEINQLKQDIKALGACFANNGKSIHSHWLSSACVQCRTGEGSYTTFLSLKCHRDCYFCFNPNQENYQGFQHEMRDAVGEVAAIAEQEYPLTHIALTGGEPLLFRQESIAFFAAVQQKLPQVHSRLYTAGDPLDRSTAVALANAGLKEIRFSIKIDDAEERIEKVLHRIELAREIFPTVMVEMPVIPGTEPQMYKLLMRLDDIGIDGINLLEFCFPLTNSDAYQSRGFQLKNPPYEAYYNYWYAGGLAVSQSELACLRVVKFALEQQLSLGVHYCSLENKHTGQVYQSNAFFRQHAQLIGQHYLFSSRDYFYKSAKVFGDDRPQVARLLKQAGISYHEELLHGFLQFNPESILYLTSLVDLPIALTSHIIEPDEQGNPLIKEVKVELTTPTQFLLADLHEGSCNE
ncbi:radical SAM protein [Providencia sp. CRE-3FA-0001]|uniref:Radical SAM protein n=1 Tax=Providencia huashanensis TaxID=3037798 RepID=A0AA42K2K2_9GAMM|nr:MULTISPECIES: radical SAM protein [Providencia]EJD6660720.1 radical SAM protein [Providencia rettgeri]ELR5078624.1 radical SAM protein [Providencia rettgeri]ELR5171384.1 radical SAM protein [Providencia rettgeri]ELR5175239.1 radical SAM protein [Providencia rettgeri]ELR5194421.1 radical SAM protein [Providencia rettgeri]